MATVSKKRRKLTESTEVKDDDDVKESASSAITHIHGNCTNVSERYEKVGRLGEGTYGIVYKARDKINGKFYALKRCIPHHQQSDGLPITTLREIRALRTGKGKMNIVQLERVAVSRTGVFLVLEYCEHDIAKLIDGYFQKHKRSPFGPADCKSLSQQLLRGLSYLHSRHVLHRDLKMSNILYHRGCLKIADLGLSRSLASNRQGNLTPEVASLWYRAPEVLFGKGRQSYSYPLDVWASGCIMAEFVQGTPLFQGTSEVNQMELIINELGTPTSHEWRNMGSTKVSRPTDGPRGPTKLLDAFCKSATVFVDLLLAMMQYDPAQRTTSADALESSYFTEEPLPTQVTEMPQYQK